MTPPPARLETAACEAGAQAGLAALNSSIRAQRLLMMK
jgi:hypothetical protein